MADTPTDSSTPTRQLSAAELDRTALDVYRVMLRAPEIELEQIADELRLPAERVREAQDELAQHLLVGLSPRASEALRPIAPEVGLRRLIAQAEAELRQRQLQVDELRQEVGSVLDEYREARESRLSKQMEILTSQDAIVAAIEELSDRASNEMLMLMTGTPTDQDVEESRGREEEVAGKGVRTRLICLESSVDRNFADDARALAERDIDIRLLPTLPLQMMVYDDLAVVTAIDPTNPGAGAAVVRVPGIVAGMRALFEAQWALARDPQIEPARRRSDDQGLTSTEAAMLRLLAQGQKDESVARALGTSVRTTRRIVADLSERAGATSRFELAIKATQLGWLK